MTRSTAEALEAPASEASWLLEDDHGRLVAHRLFDLDRVPSAAKTAVLSGDLAHLDRAATRRRTAGLVRSGPVLQGVVDDRAVVRVPLEGGGLWMLLDDVPSLAQLEAAGRRVEPLLDRLPVHQALLWCLDGHPDAVLPATLAGRSTFWVLAMVGRAEPVAATLRDAGLGVETCTQELTTYVVIGASARTTTAHVLHHARRILAEGRGGLSGACSDLPTARAQADLALRTARPGEILSTEHDRSLVVLRHLAEALANLPALGPDPLERLAAHRQASLTQTLRCWLDSGRDLAATTAALAIHPNTLRYRLQRIEQVLGVDLKRDAAAGLELHLRLQAQPQLSRRSTSTGS